MKFFADHVDESLEPGYSKWRLKENITNHKILQIQGLRSLAVLAVVLYHLNFSFIPGGYVGVDIFFVISGFLITDLLLREKEKNGKISLSKFYARRVKRLFPAFFFVTMIALFLVHRFLPATRYHESGIEAIFSIFYLQNYLFASQATDYLHLSAGSASVFLHYWSLAVEEQFYLFWPALIIILTKKVFSLKKIFISFGIFTLLSFLLEIFVSSQKTEISFFSYPTRGFELAIGALVAVFVEMGYRLANKMAELFTLLGSLFLVISIFKFNDNTLFPGYAVLLPVTGTALLLYSFVHKNTNIFDTIFSNKILGFIGTISYSLYLWHWPLIEIVSERRGILSFLTKIIIFLSAILLATLTYYLIENPFRKYKRISKAPTNSFGLYGIGSLILLLSSVALLLQGGNFSIQGENLKTVNLSTVKQNPGYYTDGCSLSLDSTKSGICRYGDWQGKKKILLFGDSHAGQWQDAMAKLGTKNHFEVISLIKSGCPAAEVTVKANNKTSPYSACDKWRENMIKRINQIEKPDIIIISSLSIYAPYDKAIKDRMNWWSNGLSNTIKKLKNDKVKILILGDTPFPIKNIPDCIAANAHDVNKCNITLSSQQNFDMSILESKLANKLNVSYFNPKPWLCTRKDCPAVINGVVVYRDASHISLTYARVLAPSVLKNVLKETGVKL